MSPSLTLAPAGVSLVMTSWEKFCADNCGTKTARASTAAVVPVRRTVRTKSRRSTVAVPGTPRAGVPVEARCQDRIAHRAPRMATPTTTATTTRRGRCGGRGGGGGGSTGGRSGAVVRGNSVVVARLRIDLTGPVNQSASPAVRRGWEGLKVAALLAGT